MDRTSDTSNKQEHHSVLFIESVKRHLKGHFIPTSTAGWWKALSWKGVGWPIRYFLQREKFQHSAAYHVAVLHDRWVQQNRGQEGWWWHEQNHFVYDFSLSASTVPRETSKWHSHKSCTCKQKLLMPLNPTSPKEKTSLSFNGSEFRATSEQPRRPGSGCEK